MLFLESIFLQTQLFKLRDVLIYSNDSSKCLSCACKKNKIKLSEREISAIEELGIVKLISPYFIHFWNGGRINQEMVDTIKYWCTLKKK